MTGSLSINQVVQVQEDTAWFILLQPLGFLIFFIAMLSEISRPPFDLLESDSEIVAGCATEYSGFRYGIFLMGELGEQVAMSCLVTTFFLGGYVGPGPLAAWPLGVLWFSIKALGVYFVIGWIRCTVPRMRVDQWMGFAWKGLLPLAMLNLVIVAVEVVAFGSGADFPAWAILINVPACILLIWLWSRMYKTGGGRVNVRPIRQGYRQGSQDHLYQPVAKADNNPVS
jgi:NADH:ubiquinone oxidoreductase subunit H